MHMEENGQKLYLKIKKQTPYQNCTDKVPNISLIKLKMKAFIQQNSIRAYAPKGAHFLQFSDSQRQITLQAWTQGKHPIPFFQCCPPSVFKAKANINYHLPHNTE